jgi:hypothetical protein
VCDISHPFVPVIAVVVSVGMRTTSYLGVVSLNGLTQGPKIIFLGLWVSAVSCGDLQQADAGSKKVKRTSRLLIVVDGFERGKLLSVFYSFFFLNARRHFSPSIHAFIYHRSLAPYL